MRKNSKKGFTLVEIMIVVTIVGLLAIIAVPIFIRARINANEQILRGDLRSFTSANESYQTTQNPAAYAVDIATLIGQGYLDNAWAAGGRRHGYQFSYALGSNGMTYSIVATPAIQNITGINVYCTDQTGVLLMGASGTGNGCMGGTAVTSQ